MCQFIARRHLITSVLLGVKQRATAYDYQSSFVWTQIHCHVITSSGGLCAVILDYICKKDLTYIDRSRLTLLL